MWSLKMNSESAKKLIALLVAAYVIPQAINLVLKLVWVISLLFVSFLVADIAIIIMIKAWYPDKVSVIGALEWALYTSLGFSSSFLNVFRYLVHSVFELVYGKVYQNQGEGSSRDRRVALRNQEGMRMKSARRRPMPSSIMALTKSAKLQPTEIRHVTF